MPRIRYDVDATGAANAQKALARAMKEVEEGADDSVKGLTRAERAAKKLSEQADPTERYARKMRDLARAVKDGGLEQEKAEGLARKYNDQLERVGQTSRRAFDVGSLAKYAAGFVTVQGAISGATSFLRQMAQNAQEAAQRTRDALDSVLELQQLEGSPELAKFSTDLVRQGTFSDRGQAADFAFATNSSGLSVADAQEFADLAIYSGAIKQSDAAEVAAAVKKAQRLGRFGSIGETLQKLTQASGGTASNIPTLAKASTTFASQFSGVGFSGDEALAALELGEGVTKNADTAAEKLKSLAAQLAKRQIDTSGGLVPTINRIKGKITGRKTAYDILGEENAVAAFQFFDELGEQESFLQKRGLIESAPQRDVVGGRFNALADDPIIGSALASRRAKSLAQSTAEKVTAERANLFDAVIQSKIAANLEDGYGEGYAALTQLTALPLTLIGAQDFKIKQAYNRERDSGNLGDGGVLSSELENRIADYLRRTAEASERTANSAEGTGVSGARQE